MWQYNSLATSTLASGIDGSVTSLDVASGEGARFPSSGDFWIHVHVAGAIGELMKCTARSSDTLTVTRGQDGTSGAAHTGGEKVELVVSAAALNQLRIDICQTGAYGSRPAAAKAGGLWLPNNSFYLERDTGSGWTPWGPIYQMTPPVSGDFAWNNQDTATVSTTKGGITIARTGTNSGLHQRVKTAPSTPYSIRTAWLANPHPGADVWFGPIFRQSSDDKAIAWMVKSSDGTFKVLKYNTATSFNSFAFDQSCLGIPRSPTWLRIDDDGTDRKVYVSGDGQNWALCFSEGRTTFMTADQVGFALVTGSASAEGSATLIDWTQS